MNKHDLLEKETNEVLNSAETKQMATRAYLILSIACFMIMGIMLCVKTAEIQALKSKTHNDSLANKSLKDNLLIEK